MESRIKEIKSALNPAIKIPLIPGHFATNHSHINYYIDLTKVKTVHTDALRVADELAKEFLYKQIDTIVCVDDMQMVAAFMAKKLSESRASVNYGVDVNVIVPEFNSSSQMIFRDNIQKAVWNKKILLLIASATTGKTIKRCFECIRYYSGEPVGVAAIFSAENEVDGIGISSVFSMNDVPDYKTYRHSECPLCKEGKKLDAIVNSLGYTKL